MTRRRTPQCRGSGGERGNALIEFALSFSVLVSLFLGTFQFGYSFFMYNRLETAVRAGARLGSLLTYNSPNTTLPTAYRDQIRNMVVYGTTTTPSPAVPVVPGLTTANVNVQMLTEGGVPASVRVSLQNFALNAVVTTVNLNGKPRVTVPYMGNWIPVPLP